MKNKIYNLFASCKLVKGASRAIICDLQRGRIYPIPLTLYNILIMEGKSTWNQIIKTFQIEQLDIMEEYYHFLVEEELVFFNDNPELFPSISMDWDEPYRVTNCILDFDVVEEQKIDMINNAIGSLNIKSLQIRLFESTSIEKLSLILSRIKPLGLESIELIMPYTEEINEKKLLDLCLENPHVFTITVFGAPNDKYLNNGVDHFGQIFFLNESINSEKCCGKVSSDFFTINMKTFTESQVYNSCLNRKISVDTNGNIRNCPSMQESYGHISNVTFEDVLSNSSISKYWKIHKDLISTCKDCEFRHICTDCRAYIEAPDEILSKPLKCGYNPYTCEWEEWSTNPLKEKAIKHYGMEDLVKRENGMED